MAAHAAALVDGCTVNRLGYHLGHGQAPEMAEYYIDRTSHGSAPESAPALGFPIHYRGHRQRVSGKGAEVSADPRDLDQTAGSG